MNGLGKLTYTDIHALVSSFNSLSSEGTFREKKLKGGIDMRVALVAIETTCLSPLEEVASLNYNLIKVERMLTYTCEL